MYNIHQHNSIRRMHENRREEEEKYTRYLLRHACNSIFIQSSSRKHYRNKSLNSSIIQQNNTEQPFYFEDDHHKTWRPIKQYRDVEDSNKFVAFKTFRHKPYYDMDKYFNERERKQILQLSQRKQSLVKSKLIPEVQRNRSQRSQGPLNPKISFRERLKDQQYLQPRLRFTNVTDKQRMNETAISYDDKFTSLYKSFEMSKSRIGRTIVSPSRTRREQPKGTLDYFDDTKSETGKSKSFYYERQNTGDAAQQHDESSLIKDSGKLNPQNSQRSSTADHSRTYFKLAKTVQLLSKDESQKRAIQALLKRSQFERLKDMKNIVHNKHGENYSKSPIL